MKIAIIVLVLVLLVVIVVATIFHQRFQDAVLGKADSGEAVVFGILTVRGATMFLLCALFLGTAVYLVQDPPNTGTEEIKIPEERNEALRERTIAAEKKAENLTMQLDRLRKDTSKTNCISQGEHDEAKRDAQRKISQLTGEISKLRDSNSNCTQTPQRRKTREVRGVPVSVRYQANGSATASCMTGSQKLVRCDLICDGSESCGGMKAQGGGKTSKGTCEYQIWNSNAGEMPMMTAIAYCEDE